MKDDLERRLFEFSEKHGAVLLGMHNELQEMQSTVDAARKEASEIQKARQDLKESIESQQGEIERSLNVIKSDLTAKFEDLSGKQKSSLEAEIRGLKLLISKELALISAKQQAGLETVNNALYAGLAEITAKQAEAHKLYEKSLTLLTEQKEREEKFNRAIEKLAKIAVGMGLSLLLVCGVLLWMR